jgi:O-antigen/teichoic acid export membrane protein
MGIILTFALNAALNFVLGLLVAKALGPAEFGVYALILAIGLVVATLGFDWIKLSATRFYGDRTRQAEPGIRATLDACQTGLALLLGAAALALVLLGVDPGLPATLAALAALMGIAAGLFEYRAALARARFLDRIYMLLVVLKNGLGFVLMLTGAFLFADARLVILGNVLAVAAALALTHRALSDRDVREAGDARVQWARVPQFLSYSLPLVGANLVFQVLPLLSRAVAVGAFGFAEAGLLSLPADIGLRLVASVGSALDVFLFQLAVRREAQGGLAAAQEQVRRNLVLVTGILLPLGAWMWLVAPAFEALAVPAAFRGAFLTYLAWLLPGFLALGLVQYAINPVFQIARTTRPILLAALTGLAVNGGLVLLLPRLMGPAGIVAAQSAGLVATFLVALALAVRLMPLVSRKRDLVVIVAATLACLGLAPWRDGPALASLAGLTLATGTIVAGALLAFDVAGIRGIGQQLLDRIRMRSVPKREK